MKRELVERIAKAVLYEGYLLYPYRPSAIKNRQRFNFGVIYPRAYAEAQKCGDACAMQTECLVQGSEPSECAVRVRFLRLVPRSILGRQEGSGELPSLENGCERIERLALDGRTYQAWQEAAEENIDIASFCLCDLVEQPMLWRFRFLSWRRTEEIRDQFGALAGGIVWEKREVSGYVELKALRLREKLFKLRVKISNDSGVPADAKREIALEHSLVSTHTVLESRGGAFVSLTDPPGEYRKFANCCENVGTWPILVGTPDERDTLLSSPIILPDYPEIAQESPGDLFDGAEIDEILSLRILSMTEDEKREMRQCDARAEQILQRTENLPEEQWMRLHGALRALRATGERP